MNKKESILNRLKDVGDWKKAIFISVLYSMFLVLLMALSFDLSLKSFTSRVISEASFRNIDIELRVQLFYSCIVLFIVVNFSVLKLFKGLAKHFNTAELQLLNYSSFAAVFLAISQAYSNHLLDNLRTISSTTDLFNMFGSFTLILNIHILIYFSCFLNNLLTKKAGKFTAEHYSGLILISFAFYFLFRECGFQQIPPAFFISCFSCIVLTIALIYEKVSGHFADETMSRLMVWAKPILFIPLLTVLSTEVYLILNNKGIYILTPGVLYLSGLVVIALFLIKNYFKRSIQKTEVKRVLFNFYFPLAIGTVLLYTYYEPIIQLSVEMYENANPALAIQQFHSFGKIPFLETFNSHLLSEIVWGFIYTFINGFNVADGHSFMIYNFMNDLLIGLVSYYFLKRYLNNGYASLFYLLFVPFFSVLLSPSFSICLFSVFILIELIKEPSVKNYFLWFLSILFFILWSIDIGVANLAGSLAVVLLSLHSDFNLKNAGKGFLIFFFILASGFILLSCISPTSLFKIIENILTHLNGTQAYGYKDLSSSYDALFLIQYFIFPLFVVLLLGYLMLNINTYKNNPATQFVFVAIVYLSVYYLINFHRGIVRHGFVEGTDEHLSTFVFFIFSGCMYLFFTQKHSPFLRFISFLIAGHFLIYSYKHPTSKTGNFNNGYDIFTTKLNQFPGIQPEHHKIKRSIPNKAFSDSTYTALVNFMDTHLKKDESFIDFSNTPMLYFYSNRKTVSYFNQIPSMLHNEYLQKDFLNGVDKQKTPFVVFSHVPERWFDHTDEVPNSIRHYRIAEYIYSNYRPYLLINNFSVWVNTSLNYRLSNTDSAVCKPDTLSGKPKFHSLIYLPRVWAKYDQKTNTNKVIWKTDPNAILPYKGHFKYSIPTPIDKSEGNYIFVTTQASNEKPVNIKVSYGINERVKGGFTFTIPAVKNNPEFKLSTNSFAIRASSQYNWKEENNWISLEMENNDSTSSGVVIKEIKILIGD